MAGLGDWSAEDALRDGEGYLGDEKVPLMMLIVGPSGAGKTTLYRSLIQELARNRKWGAVFMVCPQATYDNNPILHDVIHRKQVFTLEHWTTGGRTLKELISRIMLTVPEHKKVRNIQSLIIFDGEWLCGADTALPAVLHRLAH